MAAPPPTLKHRRDFLACARARRWAAPGLVLQARRRADELGADRGDEAGGIRVGYTCSKKLGGAVTRNRAKRRLRAAAAEVLSREGVPGWDYVVIGRPEATVERPFAQLVGDLRTALGRVHAPRKVRA